MKIVTLLGSPRTDGNSTAIARRITETAEKLGAETRTFELNRLAYRGCQGCYACKKKLDRCVLEDDLTEVLSAVSAADAVVLASPVYFGTSPPSFKGLHRPELLVPEARLRHETRSRAGSSPKKLVFVLTAGASRRKAVRRHLPPLQRLSSMVGFCRQPADPRLRIGPG